MSPPQPARIAGVRLRRRPRRRPPIDLLRSAPMCPRSIALAALVGSFVLAPAAAQAPSVEHDALLFLDSQVLPKKAEACSARIPRFSAQFEPAFRAWLSSHRQQLSSGEAYLRADAEKTRMPLDRDIESIAGKVSKQWNAAPLPDLQENCETLLLQLREGPGGE